MVFCNNCGSENSGEAKYCNNCGDHIITPSMDPIKSPTAQTYEPPYRQQNIPQNRSSPSVDHVDGYVYICSFCFPIVGIVLWLIWKNEKPNSAKGAITAAIIGFILGVFFNFLASF